MPAPILKHFEFEHLPERLKVVSRPICDLAKQMDETLPDGAEKSTGLRKLLEAKDAFVRAALVFVAALSLAGCASSLDAEAARANAANVRQMAGDVDDLAARAGEAVTPAELRTIQLRNAAAVKLADAMAADALGAVTR